MAWFQILLSKHCAKDTLKRERLGWPKEVLRHMAKIAKVHRKLLLSLAVASGVTMGGVLLPIALNVSVYNETYPPLPLYALMWFCGVFLASIVTQALLSLMSSSS